MTAAQMLGATVLIAVGIVIGYFIRKSDEKYDRANDPLPSLQEEVLAAHVERRAQDATNRRAIRRANAAGSAKVAVRPRPNFSSVFGHSTPSAG